MRRCRRLVVVVGLAVTLPLLGGCDAYVTTETGYQARPLGMGESQRKALYAPKYSSEAAQAQAEREAEASKGGLRSGAGGRMGP